MTTSPTIVVGFDATDHSLRAVEFAAREAEVRGADLHLVNAYQWIPPTTLGLPPGLAAEEAMHDASRALVEEAAATTRRRHPELTVTAVSVSGDPARVITDAARGATLLVVGGRGRGGFTGQLLGSVALRAIGLAECPVVVVRGDADATTGRIMVGVDVEDPHESADVLEFAFSEAAARGADVYVVHIWEDPAVMYLAGGSFAREAYAAVVASRRARLESLLELWRKRFPEVRVADQVFTGPPSKLLVDSTRLADLLVIGGRTRAEDHPGMRAGALAHTVLHHAHCPVAVVPEH